MTREEAIRKLQKQKAEYLEEWVDFSGVAEAYDMAIEALEQPIIRCKDCKYYMGNWYCEAWNNSPGFPAVEENMFCSMGERKDETD